MDIKDIRVHLGRVKSYYQRNDMVHAIACIIMAIKGMGNKPFPSEIRSLLREALQLVGRDAVITEHLGKPLAYQPGQEQAILLSLAKVYKAIRGLGEAESHEQAIARKVAMDRNLNQGMKLLEQKKVSEADECFSEAITHYKDEHSVFSIIGKALMEAEQVRRALPYLKRGTDVDPNNQKMKELFDKCMELRAKL